MADEPNKLSGKVGLDTTDFKTNAAALNREMRLVESGFRASAAALGDWTKDATGLESRIKALNSEIEIQGKKVANTRAEYERMVEIHGEDSRAAQDLEIKLNKETETLNKMNVELVQTDDALTELKSGSDEAGQGVKDLGDKSNETGGKMESLKTVLKGVGEVAKATVGLVLGLVAGVAAVGAAVGGLVFSTAAAADQLETLSAQTGISTEKLQEMRFAGEILGTSIDTITGAHAKLVKSMFAGKDGTGAQADAFKALGVQVTDASGQLRDQQAVFDETIDKLGGIENPAERDALAMQIFGKSAQELNPLIKAGSEGMAELARQAHEVGAVMNEEDVAAAASFQDQLDALKLGLQGTAGTVASAFLPAFSGVAGEAQGFLKDLVGIVKGSNGDIGQIATGVGGLVGKIATSLAAQAPKFLNAGLGMLKSVISGILSTLPVLLPAVISILTSLIDFLVANLPLLVQAGIDIVLALVNGILPQLPRLIKVAIGAIVTLANGIAGALPLLVPVIIETLLMIVQVLLDNLPILIEAGLALINALATGLVAAIPILIPAIPVIYKALFDALIKSLPIIGKAAGQLILTLLTGIVTELPLLLPAGRRMVEVVTNGIKGLAGALLEAGKAVVDGVWKGIQAKKDWFYSQIKNFFSGLIKAAKDALGISSPSKPFAEIGQNLSGSLSTSFFTGLEQTRRRLAGAMSGFSQTAAAGAASGVTQSIQNDNFTLQAFAPIIFQGSQTPGSVGAQIKGKRV